jgi:hypothetical protein
VHVVQPSFGLHGVRHCPLESHTSGCAQPSLVHEVAVSGTHPKPFVLPPLLLEAVPSRHRWSARQSESAVHEARQTLRTHAIPEPAQGVGVSESRTHGEPRPPSLEVPAERPRMPLHPA